MNFESFVNQTQSEWELSAIRGLQVVCTISIIIAYTCSMMEYISNNRYTVSELTTKLLSFVKRNSTYLIDMFFFLSGSNLTYLYFKTSYQGKCRVLEQIIHFTAMITYKVCCIILPYTLVLICTELTSKYFYSNSALDLPSFDHITCVHDKWLNILYIENFFPIVDRCMLWTWFISLEVHFFIAACLVLLLAQIHPKYAGAICTGILIASILATTVVEVDYIPAVKRDVEHELMAFYLIFDKIWVRIPPYLLGMCLGYTLYKAGGKFEMNIFVIVFGWIACVLILAGFGYGFHTVEFRVNPWVRAIISTLGHTIWSMVLFWIVLASISQYGGKY
ncbi:uncharacterized protein LOC119655646 [Hermetia illucens]|uniref:uncharacterized protein LOC119655646 n=1 Tax=Hermetia illucens TaxID=343691 RepID=UPI0018CC280B|nr:uncharacterized protein LOC119655646 [Hermetia illucens]